LGLLTIIFILALVYSLGILRMGKRTNRNILKIGALTNIISLVLFVSISLVISFFISTSFEGTNSLLEIIDLIGTLSIWSFVLFGLFVIYLITRYLISISILQLPLSKTPGILGLISAILVTLFIILLIWFLVNPFTVLLLGVSPIWKDIFFWSLVATGILILLSLLFESLLLLKMSKSYESK